MDAIVDSAKDVLVGFASEAEKVFCTYDEAVIQRRKKISKNIDARYICQFTFQLLNRQVGGFRGVADRLAETLGKDCSLTYAASSICEARKKYPSELFLDLNKTLLKQSEVIDTKWKGKRLFAIDGSKIVVPRSLIKNGFRTEKKESHYPTGRLSCLYEIKSQLIHDVSLNSHCDERRAALAHLSILQSNDVVIYDRGYFSFKLIAAHRQQKSDFVIRFSEGQTGIKELEDFISNSKNKDSCESLVTLEPRGKRAQKQLSKDYPGESQKFSVRLIKYTYEDNPYYLVTSLLNSEIYPLKEFPDLYHSRWGVEEAYKQIKVNLLRKEFHGNCYKTVCQEIYGSALLINISRLMSYAAESNKSRMKKKYFAQPLRAKEHSLASQQVICVLSNPIVSNCIA